MNKIVTLFLLFLPCFIFSQVGIEQDPSFNIKTISFRVNGNNVILNITKEFLQPDNKRLNKKSDSSYYLLHKAKVPSVMVECGFMSNREENKKLQDEKYQNKLAYLIMLGLNIYITEEL